MARETPPHGNFPPSSDAVILIRCLERATDVDELLWLGEVGAALKAGKQLSQKVHDALVAMALRLRAMPRPPKRGTRKVTDDSVRVVAAEPTPGEIVAMEVLSRRPLSPPGRRIA